MNSGGRIVFVETCGVSAIMMGAIVIGPRLASAQVPVPPPNETLSSWLVLSGIFAALVLVLGAGVKLYDTKRKREGQGLFLQARLSEVLLQDPEVGRLPIAATVQVPFWRRERALVAISGRVPTRALREAAVHLVLEQAVAAWPGARIEDRIAVEPQAVPQVA
jgi:hypothetical protein